MKGIVMFDASDLFCRFGRGPMDLSAIETSILRCLAEGMQSKEIAICVGRSKPTVESYIRLLFAKFNARSRAQLVVLAMKSGALGEPLDSLEDSA